MTRVSSFCITSPLLVLLFACHVHGGSTVGSTACDLSSTCVGPVVQRWSTSTCSGNSTFYSVLPASGCNILSQAQNSSIEAVCPDGSASLEIHDFYGSTACTSGNMARKRWYKTGVCLARPEGGSEAYWCSAGGVGSVAQRKTPSSSFSSLPALSSRCTANPDIGCGVKIPTLFFYRFDDCTAVPMTSENPFFGNGVLDTCYATAFSSSSKFLVQSTCATNGFKLSYYESKCPSVNDTATDSSIFAFDQWFSTPSTCYPSVPLKTPYFSSNSGFLRPDCMYRLPSSAMPSGGKSHLLLYIKAMIVSLVLGMIR